MSKNIHSGTVYNNLRLETIQFISWEFTAKITQSILTWISVINIIMSNTGKEQSCFGKTGSNKNAKEKFSLLVPFANL